MNSKWMVLNILKGYKIINKKNVYYKSHSNPTSSLRDKHFWKKNVKNWNFWKFQRIASEKK